LTRFVCSEILNGKTIGNQWLGSNLLENLIAKSMSAVAKNLYTCLLLFELKIAKSLPKKACVFGKSSNVGHI
jgi:hypothetical protein